MTVWYPHFTKEEMACRGIGCDCKGEPGLPKAELMEKLEQVREAFGRSMHITSGFRCGSHNAKVSQSGRTGPHTTGLAVDLACYSYDAFKLIQIAMSLGFQGIGVSQRKGQPRFIHIDICESKGVIIRPLFWGY